MSLLIRSAVPSDATALAQIEVDSFTNPEWIAEDFLKYDCLVAQIDGQIAGFLVSREICPATADSALEREILNFAVKPGYRRSGVGTALLQQERNRAFATHFLEVRESNLVARDLYRKMGFTEIGTRRDYYQFPTETAIVMTMKCDNN